MCPSPFLSSVCLSLPLSVCPSLMHAHALLNNIRRAMSWSYLRQLIWDNNSKPFCSFLHLLQVFRLWNKHKIFSPLTIMCTLILNTMSLQHKSNVSPLFIVQSQYIFWTQNTLQFNIQLLWFPFTFIMNLIHFHWQHCAFRALSLSTSCFSNTAVTTGLLSTTLLVHI